MFLSHQTSTLASSALLVVACSPDDDSTPEAQSDTGERSESSGADETGGVDETGDANQTDDGDLEPLVALPVCETVAVGPQFAQSCSGSAVSTGDEDAVCVSEDPRCEGDICVGHILAEEFAAYCAPECTLGGGPECPLGYACQPQTSECQGEPSAAGVCARAEGTVCEAFDLSDGSLFAGPAGSLYHLSGGDELGTSVLRIRTGGGAYSELAQWEGSRSIEALVRTESQTLLVTPDHHVLIDSAGAVVSEFVPPADRLEPIYGATVDEQFVRLEVSGSAEGFAALMRREPSGAWTEVGPTSTRIHDIIALQRGFIAQCQMTELCTSDDGETFTPIALPAGAEYKALRAAGRSPRDFFLRTTDGAIHHHRDGEWVVEGPQGQPDPENGLSADRFKTFADGTLVFQTTPEDSSPKITYVYGDDCWAQSSSRSISGAEMVVLGDQPAFAVEETFDRLCFIAAR